MKISIAKLFATKKMYRGRAAGYLGVKKFNLLLFAAMVDGLQLIIVEAIDKLITGNIIGPDAIAGISLLGPIDDINMLFQFFFTTGATVMYARAVADFDSEKAKGIVGMTVFLTVIMGAVLVILSFPAEDWFLDLLGATGPAREYAKQYFTFSRFSFLLSPLYTLLGEFVIVDGDDRLVVITTVCEVVGDVVLSLILCFKIGIGGASLGSIIGLGTGLILLLYHFFKPSNALRPKMHYSFREALEMVKIGATDSVALFCDALYEAFANMWFISHFGIRLLPVMVAVSAVSDMLFMGDGAGSAINAMLLAYRGEGNRYAIRNLVRHAAKVSVFISIGFIAIVCVGARAIPFIFGIHDPQMVEMSVIGCRIQSIEMLPYILIAMLSVYYIGIEKYGLAISLNAMNSLFIRVPMVILFSCLLGMNGVWLGVGLTSYVVILVLAMIVGLIYGKGSFPMLDLNRSTKSFNICFPITPEESVKASEKIEKFLVKRKVDSTTIIKAKLVMEEFPLLVAEVNKDCDKAMKGAIDIDAFAAVEKAGIRMVFWYDGDMDDVSDPEHIPESLRGFLMSELMAETESRNYLPTAGYNRVSFLLPY